MCHKRDEVFVGDVRGLRRAWFASILLAEMEEKLQSTGALAE